MRRGFFVSWRNIAISFKMPVAGAKRAVQVKVGSKVRLVGVHDGLEDCPDFPTKSTFEKCIGHDFVIAGFNEVGMAELDIESVTGSLVNQSGLNRDF
jgi:hypothetical protein